MLLRSVFLIILLAFGSCNQATLTLTPAKSISLSFSTDVLIISEGSGAVIGIFLSEKRSEDTIVNVSLSSPRNDVAADFSSYPSTIVIPANSMSASLSLSTVNDGAYENNENFSLVLSTGAQRVVANSPLTITIIDQDVPKASITTVSASVSEMAASTAGTFTINLDKAPTVPVSLQVTSVGTATLGTDFTLTETQLVNFSVGETSKTLTVHAIEDGVWEGTEAITFQLGNFSNLLAGASAQATIPLWDVLDLNFGSLFNDGTNMTTRPAPFNRMTISRTSAGSFVDADGILKYAPMDIPRFDHHPLTGEPLGIMSEAHADSSLTNSEAFEIDWVRSGVQPFVPGTTLDSTATRTPDNKMNAEMLIEDGTTGFHGISRANAGSANNDWTYSVFVKAAGRNAISMRVSGAVNTNWSQTTCPLNSALPMVQSQGGNGVLSTNFERQEFKNGWFRCSAKLRGTNVASSTTFSIGLLDDQGSDTYAGNGTAGVYVWGVNAARTSVVVLTSYIPTGGTTTTRIQDTNVIQDVSGFFNLSGGTIFNEFSIQGKVTPTSGLSARLFSIDDGSTANNIQVVARYDTGTTTAVFSGGNVFSPAPTLNDVIEPPVLSQRIGLSYSASKYDFVVNQTHFVSPSLTALPQMLTRLFIGRNHTTGYHLKGSVYRFLYTPTVFSLARLQDWTTANHLVRSFVPTVRLAQSAFSAHESDGPTSFIIGLNERSASAVTVNYSLSGSAAMGDDYSSVSPQSGTITFAPGETRKIVTIQPIVDAVAEASGETIVLTLSTPTNAHLGSVTTSELTLND